MIVMNPQICIHISFLDICIYLLDYFRLKNYISLYISVLCFQKILSKQCLIVFIPNVSHVLVLIFLLPLPLLLLLFILLLLRLLFIFNLFFQVIIPNTLTVFLMHPFFVCLNFFVFSYARILNVLRQHTFGISQSVVQ